MLLHRESRCWGEVERASQRGFGSAFWTFHLLTFVPSIPYALRHFVAAMAGGLVKYRHLSRKSSHRTALLRNLVTSLIEHESISTTWHKAKEAQRLAEKMITLGKKNTEASKRQALKFFFVRAMYSGIQCSY